MTPIINYLSDDENPAEILALVKEARSNLIIRAFKGVVPMTLESKLTILENLIELANAAKVPNERLFADPSLVHISTGMGQEHLLNTYESIVVLNQMIEPPLNSIVWLSSITTGLPKTLKSIVASTYLSYLAGAGLNVALVNVKDEIVMKSVCLIKIFRDEIVFTPADIV